MTRERLSDNFVIASFWLNILSSEWVNSEIKEAIATSAKHYLYWKNVNEIYWVTTILKYYYKPRVWILKTACPWRMRNTKRDYHKLFPQQRFGKGPATVSLGLYNQGRRPPGSLMSGRVWGHSLEQAAK